MQNDMTVWILYNPSAGAQQQAKINDLASQLISRNINLTVISTRDREDTVSSRALVEMTVRLIMRLTS